MLWVGELSSSPTDDQSASSWDGTKLGSACIGAPVWSTMVIMARHPECSRWDVDVDAFMGVRMYEAHSEC
jgi:hypothetical protein